MTQRFAVIGLGRMGARLALQAREQGFEVVGLDPAGVHPELQAAGVEPMTALSDLTSSLAAPRVVLIYLAGAIDSLLDELVAVLAPGDVIVDGATSYWRDTIRRQKRLATYAIDLVDAGTSEGARHGTCFMTGGTVEAVARVESIFKALAVDGGYVHAGPPGAGHFSKYVHDQIELGMLRAIDEGIDLLRHYDGDLDLAGVLACWRQGAVIRGWLIEAVHDELVKHGGFAEIASVVDDATPTGTMKVHGLGYHLPRTRLGARARPSLRQRTPIKLPTRPPRARR